MFDFETFDVDEDGVLNLMEAQHVLRSLGFKGFDAKSVCFSKMSSKLIMICSKIVTMHYSQPDNPSTFLRQQ